jgi:hypothetical protein
VFREDFLEEERPGQILKAGSCTSERDKVLLGEDRGCQGQKVSVDQRKWTVWEKGLEAGALAECTCHGSELTLWTTGRDPAMNTHWGVCPVHSESC